MNPKIVLAAILTLAGAPLPLHAATNANDNANTTRTFSQKLSAAGLDGVKLTVNVGDVRVTTADTDTVSITAQAQPGGNGHFIFDWTTGPSANAVPADLQLVAERQGTQLVVRLASAAGSASSAATVNPAASASGKHIMTFTLGGKMTFTDGGDESGWKADWTLVLPRRLALDLKTGVGSVEINGIAGGLKANIGVGKLSAQLPQGPLNAKVGVGNISAAIASADYSAVDLSAGVGDVGFTVNGHKNSTNYEHQFTAASQHLDGSGTTAYTLKAGVGHVTLDLGSKDMSVPVDDGPDD
ncbi:MAG: hypothetical protein ACRES7_06335 [Gammaproteobacteria bacterium]